MTLKQVAKFIKGVSLCLCLLPSAHSQEFSVGWESWYPYQFYKEADKLTGLDIEIFNLIAKKIDVNPKYVELPWQRNLMYIKAGRLDAVLGSSFTKERQQSALFSLPYRVESINLFVKKGTSESLKLNKLSDLIGTNYLIGVENGYYYGEEYQRLTKIPEFMSRINGVLDIEQNVKMLLKGYINGFLADPLTVQIIERKIKIQNELEKHPLILSSNDIFIMMSKKSVNRSQLAKINQAILELKQNGKIAEIVKYWTDPKNVSDF